jgi:hypothetical protein
MVQNLAANPPINWVSRKVPSLCRWVSYYLKTLHMKKAILSLLVLGMALPFGASALVTVNQPTSEGWNTIQGQVAFEEVGDSLIAELDGFEIFKITSNCDRWNPCVVKASSVRGSDGKWIDTVTIQDKEFAFDVNMNAGKDFGMFMLSGDEKSGI